MPRILIVFLGAATASLLFADPALAQETAPAAPPQRGEGWYFGVTQIIFVLIVFWMWVKTTDWASYDCQTLGLEHAKWSPVLFFPFLFGFVLTLFIPGPWWLFFLVNLPILILCVAVPLTLYIKHRNLYVTVDERVMTPDHIRHVLATRTKMGVKAEKEKPYQAGAPVELRAMGAADESQNQANIIVARQNAEGYVATKNVIAQAAEKRAEKVMLDYTPQDVKVRFLIDGVWHDGEAMERAPGDALLEAAKKIANLDEKDRRNKQEGKFGANYKDLKYVCLLSSQGVKTGERAIVHLTLPKEKKFKTLEELGMREKMREKTLQLMLSKKGLIVFSSLPGGGLTTTSTVAIGSTDRLLRDFISVEDVKNREPEVENVEPHTYDASQGEKPVTRLPSLIRREPDCVVIMDPVEKETFDFMSQQLAKDDLLFFTSVRAKEAPEAILRLLATYKVAPKDLAPLLVFVLNTRLIRKLCPKCKEPFQPSPEFLQKLGIPPERVTELYRERQPPGPDATEREKKEKSIPCTKCGDLRYFGRTAIFELLEVNDQVREAIVKQPKLEVLKKVARAAGNRGLQEEGILLVAQGVTSLEELQRVLKQ
ncbi:MAG: Flp pilus assembly complex ATPase component TadA [Planctomycetes bacterium]|nr:Flp pilus assembly complex ATPase component TadA [Planctomycetota bacterium]